VTGDDIWTSDSIHSGRRCGSGTVFPVVAEAVVVLSHGSVGQGHVQIIFLTTRLGNVGRVHFGMVVEVESYCGMCVQVPVAPSKVHP
jgi:hypothetical protein